MNLFRSLRKGFSRLTDNCYYVFSQAAKANRRRTSFYRQTMHRGNFFPFWERRFQYFLDVNGDYQVSQLLKAIEYDKRRLIAIDIGANVGLITRILSRHYKTVLAFEPSSDNRACIYRNLDEGVNNVITYPFALGDVSRSASILINKVNCGGNEVSTPATRERPWFSRQENIRIFPLDDVLIQGTEISDCVSLIKIDVQGFEAAVLRGASNLIRRCKPIILCEVETSEINGVDLVLDAMNDLGYVVADKIKKDIIFLHKDCLS